MKRALCFLLLLLLAAPAAADHQLEELDEVIADPHRVLDTVLDGVSSAVESVGSAAEKTGEGILDGASALGRWIGQAVGAIGHAMGATAKALGAAGAITAVGLGGAVIAMGGVAGSILSGTGALTGSVIAATGHGLWLGIGAIGGALAFVGGAYADLVRLLRPEAMPPIAFAAVVGTGAAATAGVGSWAGWEVLRRWGAVAGGLGGVAGFSRIQDDELLQHPVRSQIFETIQGHPGIHASHLAREVGVGWGTVSHHLDKLQKARMVTTRSVNNQKCYFENGGQVSSHDMEVASAVKGDTAGRISAFVHHHPMSSQKVMAEALGISPALASFHVKKLTNLGVLDKVRHGKETLLTTSQAMRRLLEADRDLMAAVQARSDEGMQFVA